MNRDSLTRRIDGSNGRKKKQYTLHTCEVFLPIIRSHLVFMPRKNILWRFSLACMHVLMAYRMGFDLSLANYLTSFLSLVSFQSASSFLSIPRDCFLMFFSCWLFDFFLVLPVAVFFPSIAILVSPLIQESLLDSVDCLFAALVYLRVGMLIDIYACAPIFSPFHVESRKRELNISLKNIHQTFYFSFEVPLTNIFDVF